MRLSEKEGRILECVQLQADLSIAEIRKQTGYRDHTIRYSINALEERGVAKRLPFINLHALGYTLHNVFFSLGAGSRKKHAAFLEELCNLKQVTWVAEMGAEFQYGIEIAARHFSDVRNTLNHLSQKFPNCFFHKSVSSQFSVTLLPRGYLSDSKSRIKPFGMNRGGNKVEVDQLDDAILRTLTTRPELSHRMAARELKVPLSTFELRVKKLREKGVLIGYFYAINPARFNAETYKVLVYGKGINPGLTQRMLAFAAKHPHMISFIECFGSWDYEIGIEVTHPQQTALIAQEIYQEFGEEINTLKILSKFRDVKAALYPA